MFTQFQTADKIVDRFKTGFKLELLTGAEVTGWNGRAMPKQLGERNVIRGFFGDSQIQYHAPRLHVVAYDCMQIPIDHVAFSNANEVARTLVHEMSPVAAFTEDVLYKHESFAKNEGEKNADSDAWFARRMMKLTQPGTYQKFEKA